MQKDKVIDKVKKDFPEFDEMVSGLPLADLEKNINLYAKQREEVELAKSESEEIAALKEQLKQTNAPYNDALKALKLKLAYLYILIQDKKPVE